MMADIQTLQELCHAGVSEPTWTMNSQSTAKIRYVPEAHLGDSGWVERWTENKDSRTDLMRQGDAVYKSNAKR